MIIITTGATRNVLLVGKYAIKFPSTFSYRNFLQGILANQQEYQFSKIKDFQHKLCPVLFRLPTFLIIVMPRVRVLRPNELSKQFLSEFIRINDSWTIHAETKYSSFGWLNSRLVAIDYGS